jgi:hypothetical protein
VKFIIILVLQPFESIKRTILTMENHMQQRNLDYINEDEDSYLYEQPSSYRDLNGLSPEDLCQPLEDDVKYRALAFSEPSINLSIHQEPYNIKSEYMGLSKPALASSKGSSLKIEKVSGSNILEPYWGMKPSRNSQESSSNKSNLVHIPEKPCYVMPTSIVCNMRLDMIRDQILMILDNCSEVTYEFDASHYKWSGIFVCGTNHCKFQIQIYTNTPDVDYLVELARVKVTKL